MNSLKRNAIIEAKSIKLHKLYIEEILELIDSRNVFELKNMYDSAWTLEEKDYYGKILQDLNEIIGRCGKAPNYILSRTSLQPRDSF